MCMCLFWKGTLISLLLIISIIKKIYSRINRKKLRWRNNKNNSKQNDMLMIMLLQINTNIVMTCYDYDHHVFPPLGLARLATLWHSWRRRYAWTPPETRWQPWCNASYFRRARGLQELKSRGYDGHHSKMNLILILNMPQETMVYLEKF